MSSSDQPKILIFDIETMPNMREAFKVWPRLDSFPGNTFKASLSSVVTFGYKWFGDKNAKTINAWDFEPWNKPFTDPISFFENKSNDKPLLEKVLELFMEADAIVTQNGKRFDHKFLQTRLMKRELPIIPKIHHIDTKVVSKSNMTVFSNSLDYMGEFFLGENKMENGGWKLWDDLLWQNCEKSQKIMSKYCKRDVELLEKLFVKFRPFMKDIPNHNVFRRDGVECCPNCGGFNLMKNGRRYHSNKIYQRYACRDCGTPFKVHEKQKFPKTL